MKNLREDKNWRRKTVKNRPKEMENKTALAFSIIYVNIYYLYWYDTKYIYIYIYIYRYLSSGIESFGEYI